MSTGTWCLAAPLPCNGIRSIMHGKILFPHGSKDKLYGYTTGETCLIRCACC